MFSACDLQADTAAKRIGKVLNINRDNEKMMEDYERVASDVCICTLLPPIVTRILFLLTISLTHQTYL